MKEFEPNVLKEIDEDFYFLTGTRAFNENSHNIIYSNDSSDYDYIVDIRLRHIILDWLRMKGYEVEMSCYNGGFKFTEDGRTYNIITAIHVEFLAWKFALETLQRIIEMDLAYANMLLNKLFRYSFYEHFRAIFKSIYTISHNKEAENGNVAWPIF